MIVLERLQAPQWINRPQPESPFLWQAFQALRLSRTMDGHIPHAAVMAYCDENGLGCPVERWRMMRIMTAMNNAENADGAATQA